MRKLHLICATVITAAALALILVANFTGDSAQELTAVSGCAAYETRLFDKSRVHTIDLQVEDWQAFVSDADMEKYTPCTATIDGEKFEFVGLRAKGNNSRRLTSEYGLDRYSLKLEFDQYVINGNYYGLDKFSLDSSFQDNSYMKTFLVYDMMDFMGVTVPLCSYVNVTVNGQPWGLFLAIEEPEEGFLRRCYSGAGQLYKPDYKSLSDENADLALRYIDNNPESYDNIFRNAKFDISYSDKMRLIGAIKQLNEGEDIASAVDVDAVLRYFAVQVFVLNMDSMLGPTGHNYYLYEHEGKMTILPWDYNLAFGTYCLGMTNPIRDSQVIINYPVNTPWAGEVMLGRPLYHNLMSNSEYFAQYRALLDEFITQYVESGRCTQLIGSTRQMIAPYVAIDSSAFCTYEDFILGTQTLEQICILRAQSVRGQLEGRYPATLKDFEQGIPGVDTAGLDIRNLGDFEDLENASLRNN